MEYLSGASCVFEIWNRYILKYFVKAPHWKLLSLVFSRRLQNFARNFQQIFKIFKARNYKGNEVLFQSNNKWVFFSFDFWGYIKACKDNQTL